MPVARDAKKIFLVDRGQKSQHLFANNSCGTASSKLKIVEKLSQPSSAPRNFPLFREEALKAQKNSFGSVNLYSPPHCWLMAGSAALLSIAVIVFLLFGTYTRRERLVGQLLPSKGSLKVTASLAGTVTELHVQEGTIVNAGDPLITISSETTTELGSTRELIGQQLQLQRLGLEADHKDQVQLDKEIRQGLSLQTRVLKDQLSQLESQQMQRIGQVQLAASQLSRRQQLQAQGFMSSIQVDQQEASLLDAKARLQDLLKQRLDIDHRLNQIRQQERELPLTTRSRQNAINRKLAEIDQTMAENESRRSIVLRAPQPSMVAAVLAKPGQFSNVGQTVLSLLPSGAALEAHLMVPSRAVGFIREGKAVVLRYHAYPYQKFGQHRGRVSEISRTALWPNEVVQQTGQSNVGEPHYRVVVALDRDEILAYGRLEKLRPGMALEADVLLDKRRLIEWIFEPLHALGRRAGT